MRLLSFKDLRAQGIVKDYRDLNLKIAERNFPPGRMTGKRSRRWTENEIAEWYQSLPTAIEAKPALRGYARQSAEAKRQHATAQREAS